MKRVPAYLVIISVIYLVTGALAVFVMESPRLELACQLGYPLLLSLPLIFRPFGRWLDMS